MNRFPRRETIYRRSASEIIDDASDPYVFDEPSTSTGGQNYSPDQYEVLADDLFFVPGRNFDDEYESRSMAAESDISFDFDESVPIDLRDSSTPIDEERSTPILFDEESIDFDVDREEEERLRIGYDDIFESGEIGDRALLLPGSNVKLTKTGEVWVHRNDMPTCAPFARQYTSSYGADETDIVWKVDPTAPADIQILPVDAPDFIRFTPRMQKELDGCKDPLRFFEQIVTDHVLTRILEFTNSYGASEIEKAQREFDEKELDQGGRGCDESNIDQSTQGRRNQRPKDFQEFDLVELKAFCGIFLILGEKALQDESLDRLFSVDMGSVNLMLIRTFTRDRMKSLLRLIRFDDKVNRPTVMARSHKIKRVFNPIIDNIKRMFIGGRFVTIDEALVAYKGRVAFLMYMPNKPAKYGIKIFVLADARSGIILNASLYTAEDETDSDDEDETDEARNENLGKMANLVLDLSKDIYGSGRVIVMDRGFTSIELVQELRKRGLDAIGTVTASSKGIPKPLRLLKLHAYYHGTAKAKEKIEREVYADSGKMHPDDVEKSTVSNRGKSTTTAANRGKSTTTAANRGKSTTTASNGGKSTSAKSTIDATSSERTTERVPSLRVRKSDSSINHESTRAVNVVNSIVDRIASDLVVSPPAIKAKRKKGDVMDKKSIIDQSHAAFLFSGSIALCKYVAKQAKDNKPVYVVSTIHNEPVISSAKEGRPIMVKTYNVVKAGVDLNDQQVGNYSCRRATQRWPLRLFQWLVDESALVAHKAFIMANRKSDEELITRRDFIRQLSKKLCEPQWSRQETGENMSKRTKAILRIVAATEQYRSIHRARQFALEDSSTIDELLQKSTSSQCPEPSTAASSASSRTSRTSSAARIDSSRTSSAARIDSSYFEPTKRRRSCDDLVGSKRDTRTDRPKCYVCRSTTVYRCLLCGRPICVSRHGNPVYDGGVISTITCRRDDPSVYCLDKPIKKRRSNEN